MILEHGILFTFVKHDREQARADCFLEIVSDKRFLICVELLLVYDVDIVQFKFTEDGFIYFIKPVLLPDDGILYISKQICRSLAKKQLDFPACVGYPFYRRDAHAEELIEIGREYAKKLDAFDKRCPFVCGFLQYAVIK